MMNCDEYRQAIAAEPAFVGGGDHVAGCAACRDYRDAMRSLDRKIAAALRVDVPEMRIPELPDIDADNVVTLSSRKGLAKPAWFALAASVLLAAVIGVRMMGAGVDGYSLADEVLAHVTHDPSALRVSRVAVSDSELAAAVPGDVAQMDRDTALITYAHSCVINGHDVPHLVIQGERGPVTILLMPEESVAGAVTIEDEDTHGVILPVGNGSIAIVGARGEKLEQIEKSVLKSVMWST
jgi:hypothetical protein